MSLLRSAIAMRASIENPAISIDQALELLATGSQSETGVSVTREKALSVAAWFRAMTLRAQAVAKCWPPKVKKRVGSGYVDAPEHPAWKALRIFGEMTPFQFGLTRTGHKVSNGNGLAYIWRLGNGSPAELIPWDPARVTPHRLNGRLFYLYRSDRPEIGDRRIPASEVVHFKGMSWDGLWGVSVVEKAREVLGLSMAMRSHGARFFRHGARGGVILEAPNSLSEQAYNRLLASTRLEREGFENHWKTWILEEGLKARDPLIMSAHDAQLIESHAFTNREIGLFTGVPAVKLNDAATKTYASQEQDEQAFVEDTVGPDLDDQEQELEAKFLTESERLTESVKIEFDRSKLGRADSKGRTEEDKASLAGLPWQTRNEVRRKRGLNPLPGYDVLETPINLKQPAQPGSPAADGEDGGDGGDGGEKGEKPPKAEGADPAEAARARDVAFAARRVAADAHQRALRRLTSHARKAAKDPSKFDEFLNGARREHEGVVRGMLGPAAALLAATDGRTESFHKDVLVGDTLGACLAECARVYSTAKPAEFAAALDAAMIALETRP